MKKFSLITALFLFMVSCIYKRESFPVPRDMTLVVNQPDSMLSDSGKLLSLKETNNPNRSYRYILLPEIKSEISIPIQDLILIVLVTTISLMSILHFFCFIRERSLDRAEKERQYREIEKLQAEITLAGKEVMKIKKIYCQNNLLPELETREDAFNALYEKEQEVFRNKGTFNRLIEFRSLTQSEMQALDSDIEQSFPESTEYLKERNPAITQDMLKVYYLKKAGLPVKQIACLFSLTENTIRQKIRKIK
jgi:hypothetical protein